MSAQFTRLKGFADLHGHELAVFRRIEAMAHYVFPLYGYEEIRPPVLEATSLFQRGIGEETDVVQKEMFTFADQKGRKMSLRPEATAGVLRAAIDSGLARDSQIARLFTIGPMFRHERPQKGRMRQFHQINAECLGSDSPYADATLIAMLMQFLGSLNLTRLELKINSLGCPVCRPKYLEKLRQFLSGLSGLCDDCQRRAQTNSLRVLDCKICQDKLADAPAFRDNLCADCSEHFRTVLALLGLADISYQIDDHLVRGLDYYRRTTFEVVSDEIGAQTAIAGGGRYDGLVGALGGADVPGVGFACGMERLALLVAAPEAERPDFYIVSLDAPAMEAAFLLACRLRNEGLAGLVNTGLASLKSQMRQVDRSRARYCLILGPDELAFGQIMVKDMDASSQCLISLGRVLEVLKSNK